MFIRRLYISFAAAVTLAPVAAGAGACSSETGLYNFIMAIPSIQGGNYLITPQDGSGMSFFNGFLEGLFKVKPNNNAGTFALADVLNFPVINLKVKTTKSNAREKVEPNLKTIIDESAKASSAYPAGPNSMFTCGMADRLIGLSPTAGGFNENTSFLFHIRSNARWQNGSSFDANDFVQSVKEILYNNNGSKIKEHFSDIDKVNLINVSKLLDAESSTKNLTWESYQELWDQSDVGITALSSGTEWKKGKEGKEEKRKDWLYLRFNTAINTTYDSTLQRLVTLLGHEQGLLPVSASFIESLPGKTHEEKVQAIGAHGPATLNGNGAFIVHRASYDYEIAFLKWNNYYDHDRVLVNGYKLRIMNNVLTQSILFRAGKIINTNLAPEMVPEYLSNNSISARTYQAMDIYPAHFVGLNYDVNAKSGQDSWLQNVHLRRALYYATNRNNYILRSSQKGTKPADTFASVLVMDPAQDTANGENLRQHLVDTNGNPDYQVGVPGDNLNNQKAELPLAYGKTFDRIHWNIIDDRWMGQTDLLNQPEIAKQELNKFYIDNPNAPNPLPLTFLYNSTEVLFAQGAQQLGQDINNTFKGNSNRVDINLKAQPKGTFKADYDNHQYNMALYCFACDQGEPRNYQRYLDYYKSFSLIKGKDDSKTKDKEIPNPANGWNYTDFFKKIGWAGKKDSILSQDKDPSDTSDEEKIIYNLTNNYAKERKIPVFKSSDGGSFLKALINLYFSPLNTLTGNTGDQQFIAANDGLTFKQYNAIMGNPSASKAVKAAISDLVKIYNVEAPQQSGITFAPFSKLPNIIQQSLAFILEVAMRLDVPAINVAIDSSGWGATQGIGYSLNPVAMNYAYICTRVPKSDKYGDELPGCEALNRPDYPWV